MSTLQKDRGEILVFYILMGVVGYDSYLRFADWSIELRFLAADLVMMMIAFLLSLYKRNSSVYDAYWSVIPFYFMLVFYFESTEWNAHQWVYAGLVSGWSWRLTYNWYRSWSGWSHEDWRYVNYRNQMGKNFIWMNFFGLHLYPTLIVFASMLGMFSVLLPTTTTHSIVFPIGAGIAGIGIALEFFADNTLHQHRKEAAGTRSDVLRKGLWKYSRNPNYLGEMLFWCGLALMGFAWGAAWWTGLGAIGMIAMFLFASIPMKEARLKETKGEAFEKYMREVPRILPF